MGPGAIKTQQIIAAITHDPDRFDALLSQNPTLAKTLFMGLNLDSHTATKLSSASATLPDDPDTIREYPLKDVTGTILVKGKRLDTLISVHCFGDRPREYLTSWATQIGFRFATRPEHIKYLKSLFAKEDKGSINEEEKSVLKCHGRKRFVRNEFGALGLHGRDVIIAMDYYGGDHRNFDGALFVREFEETK